MNRRSIILMVYLIVIALLMTAQDYYTYNKAYRKGQFDALNGVYELTQQERDQIDPEGLRHHLAK